MHRNKIIAILLIGVIISILGYLVLTKKFKPSIENCAIMDNAFMNNLDCKSHTGTELNDYILPTIKK